MKKSQLVLSSLLSALGVFIYVLLVATLMSNGNRIFGTASNILAASGMLLLLVLSVAVVGLLIFGKPVYMYFDGQKQEAFTLLMYTVFWLFLIVIVTLVLLATVLKTPPLY
ncbi:MAG: hypothetical protein Q8N81_07835 [bacterium]|nr:hypothetical protein [bacterium]